MYERISEMIESIFMGLLYKDREYCVIFYNEFSRNRYLHKKTRIYRDYVGTAEIDMNYTNFPNDTTIFVSKNH